MKQYRAWYTGDNPPLLFEMVYIPDDELYFRMAEDHDFRYDFQVPFIDTDWIVEEGIGQPDKNDKEIFQGDKIMNAAGRIGVVLYYDHMCYYNVVDMNDYEQDITGNCDMINNPGDGWMLYECEIIGNIHQGVKE